MAHKKDKRIIYRKINKYLQILHENGVDVWQMYLFGSYASDTFTEESDIDLAIFLKKDDIDGFSDDVKLMHLRRNVDLRIEPHAFAMSDLEEPDPFIQEIVASGERII